MRDGMKTILVAGTYDTKDEELHYIAEVIRGQGGDVLSMDVSVLGDPSQPTDYSKHDVAEEGGSSIQAAIDSGDENHAMQIMADGAAMSFMIAGGVSSIPAAIAVWALVKPRVFGAYLGFAVTGAVIAGMIWQITA